MYDAEHGTQSLKEVLDPAMKLADGYPVETQGPNSMEAGKESISQWPYSRAAPPHLGEAPEACEIFRQADLLATLTKVVKTEQQALKTVKNRKEAG